MQNLQLQLELHLYFDLFVMNLSIISEVLTLYVQLSNIYTLEQFN